MTSMRRHYVASMSLRRHVPAGNLAPPWPPQYSKPSYAYEHVCLCPCINIFAVVEWLEQLGYGAESRRIA